MPLTILKIKGNSMHPTLAPGAFVFVCVSKHLYQTPKWLIFFKHLEILAPFRSVSEGDIVVVDHPKYGRIIKRIAEVEYTCYSAINSKSNKANPTIGNRKKLVRLKLRGDNVAQSISEQAIGWISAKYMIGKVVYIINHKS